MWRVQVNISCDKEQEYGLHHLDASSWADTKAEALEAVQLVYKALADGRESFIRAEPEADSYTDFDTKETQHRGYARFSFFDRPGGITLFPPGVHASFATLDEGKIEKVEVP